MGPEKPNMNGSAERPSPERPEPSLGKKWKKAVRIGALAAAGIAATVGGVEVVEHVTDHARQVESKEGEDDLSKLQDRDYILQYPEKFKKFPWFERSVMDSAMRNPTAAFEFIGTYLPSLSAETQRTFLKDLTDTYPRETIWEFRYLKKSVPGAEGFLRTALGRVDDMDRINLADQYKFLPESADIFNAAAASLKKNQPDRYALTLLSCYHSFSDYPGAEELLRGAIDESVVRDMSGDLLAYAARLPHVPWMTDYIKRAAEKNPMDAIRFFHSYKDIPGAEDLLKNALSRARGDDRYYSTLIGYYDTYKHVPGAADILREAAEKEAEVYGLPVGFLDNPGIYPKEPWVTKILATGAKKDPRRVLENAHKIKEGIPDASAILEIAAREIIKIKKDESFFVLCYELKDYPWFPSVLMEEAVIDPAGAIIDYGQYKDATHADDVLRRALDLVAGSNGDHSPIVNHGMEFSSKKWARPYIEKAAREFPDVFLRGAYSYVDSFPDLTRELASKAAPDEVLMAGNALLGAGDAKWVAERIAAAAVRSKESAIMDYSFYDKVPGAATIFRKIAREIAQTKPGIVLARAERFSEDPDGIIELALKTASQMDPRMILEMSHWDSTRADRAHYFEKALLDDPFTAYEEIRGRADIRAFCAGSKNPIIRRMFETAMTLGTTGRESEFWGTNAAAFLMTVQNPGMSADQAREFTKKKDQFSTYVIQKASDPSVTIGRASWDRLMGDAMLETVYRLNRLHESPDAVRFKAVDNFSAKQLYLLMAYGEEEVFTSTYNGLFNRMTTRMDQEHLTTDALLQSVGGKRSRAIVRMASRFNRLNEFLDRTSGSEAKRQILSDFVKNIESSPDNLAEAVTVADTFSMINDPGVLAVLQAQIKTEYARVTAAKDRRGIELYGLLAGLFGQKANITDEWVVEMAKKYKLPNLTEIGPDQLFNPNGSNVQEYFFYADEDGKNSFNRFLESYRNDADWKIEDHAGYVFISSAAHGGRRVEIYANKPDHESDGGEEIAKLMEARKLKSIVVVHRGHSYHAQDTIRRIPPTAKIVYLGSCGGYNNISGVLDRSSEANIISTKGTGTMQVNDPLLKRLNGKIRAGGTINWPQFWAEMEKTIPDKEDFRNYVPPHKNLGALFLKAYNKRILE